MSDRSPIQVATAPPRPPTLSYALPSLKKIRPTLVGRTPWIGWLGVFCLLWAGWGIGWFRTFSQKDWTKMYEREVRADALQVQKPVKPDQPTAPYRNGSLVSDYQRNREDVLSRTVDWDSLLTEFVSRIAYPLDSSIEYFISHFGDDLFDGFPIAAEYLFIADDITVPVFDGTPLQGGASRPAADRYFVPRRTLYVADRSLQID